MAGYETVDSPPISYGLKRLDHCVGNVPHLMEVVNYIGKATGTLLYMSLMFLEFIFTYAGFHEFAEFTAEDVGTVESGLNRYIYINALIY